MKHRLYKKSIVFAILVVLIGAVAIPSISGNNINENIVKPQPAPEVLFYDDFSVIFRYEDTVSAGVYDNLPVTDEIVTNVIFFFVQ